MAVSFNCLPVTLLIYDLLSNRAASFSLLAFYAIEACLLDDFVWKLSPSLAKVDRVVLCRDELIFF